MWKIRGKLQQWKVYGDRNKPIIKLNVIRRHNIWDGEQSCQRKLFSFNLLSKYKKLFVCDVKL